MFHRILELSAKLLYARRIRHVEKVGRAAAMAKEGKHEEALAFLAQIEEKIHPKVRSVHAFTRAKILDETGREKEAESEMIRAAKLDPSNYRAHLELAKMSGRGFHFKNAKARFSGLSDVADEEVRAQARKYLRELEDISSGKAAKQLSKKAAEIARKPLGPTKSPIGLPADIEILDRFFTEAPRQAASMLEDLSILLGESAVLSGGTWRISLFLPYSYVSFPDAPPFYPFEAAAYRLTGGDISILKFPHSHSK